MQIIEATGLDRKSGGAAWRDLRFNGPFLEMFFDRSKLPLCSLRGREIGPPVQLSYLGKMSKTTQDDH
jgi:hypothetical protein